MVSGPLTVRFSGQALRVLDFLRAKRSMEENTTLTIADVVGAALSVYSALVDLMDEDGTVTIVNEEKGTHTKLPLL